MQKIVADALRPEESRDPYGVAEARAGLDSTYELLDGQLAGQAWLAGSAFSLADCAAAPALHYAYVVNRWDEARLADLTRYFAALMARPSVARVVDEAREYRAVPAALARLRGLEGQFAAAPAVRGASRASRGGPGRLWPPRDARDVRVSPGRPRVRHASQARSRVRHAYVRTPG